MSSYLADNADDIAKRWAEIKEETRQRVMGVPLEEPKKAEEPDYPAVYGYGGMCGYVKPQGPPSWDNLPAPDMPVTLSSPDFRSLYNKACQEMAIRNAKD